MARVVEMFTEGMILLNQELATGLHPKLEKLLANHPPNEWEIRIAEIASYCGVVLDDVYTKEDFNKLGAILAGRLEVLRELPPAEVIKSLN